MVAFGGEDPDAAGAGGEEVAVLVDLEAVGQAGALVAHVVGGVEEGAAVARGAIGGEVPGFPEGALGIGVGHVEGAAVRGEGDAVGAGEFGGEQGDGAVGGATVDALEVHLAAWAVGAAFEAVGGGR